MNISANLPMASRKLPTSNDAQTPDINDEVNTLSTVRIPYIILNNNTNQDNKADEKMIEFTVDNA